MADRNNFCQDETGIIEHCLVNMASADPAERMFGRLQRDVLLAFRREKQQDPETVHLVTAVGQVIAALTVNLIVSTAKSGLERELLAILSRMVETHVEKLLAEALALRVNAGRGQVPK